MKITYRIPTKEQFAFIEVVKDYENPIDTLYIKSYYDELTNAFKEKEAGPGLPTKEFNDVLDEYIVTGKIANGADLYAQMDETQQRVIQEIKKSKNRTNK